MNARADSLVVYGAGGHGRVVADAAREAGIRVEGFLDDGIAAGTVFDGLPVLGGFEWLSGSAAVVAVALGVGDNATRAGIAARILAAGGTLATVVHPHAVVSRHAHLGDGSVVMAQAVLNSGAAVGSGAVVNTGAIVEHDAIVGDFAHIAPNASLAGGTHVGHGALVGVNASLLIGRSLGDWSVLGAGAVAIRDVPPSCVAVGVPARAIRSI